MIEAHNQPASLEQNPVFTPIPRPPLIRERMIEHLELSCEATVNVRLQMKSSPAVIESVKESYQREIDFYKGLPLGTPYSTVATEYGLVTYKGHNAKS